MTLTYDDFNIDESLLPPTLINKIPELREKFNSAIAYLSKDPIAAANLQKVIDYHVPITFWSQPNGSTANVPHGLVTWNPDALLVVNDLPGEFTTHDTSGNLITGNNLGLISPALVLYHEFLHAIDPNYPNNQSITWPGEGNITPQGETYNARYGNMAEAFAVEGERAFAEANGEILRYNHAALTWLSGNNPTQHTVVNSSGGLSWQAEMVKLA